MGDDLEEIVGGILLKEGILTFIKHVVQECYTATTQHNDNSKQQDNMTTIDLGRFNNLYIRFQGFYLSLYCIFLCLELDFVVENSWV